MFTATVNQLYSSMKQFSKFREILFIANISDLDEIFFYSSRQEHRIYRDIIHLLRLVVGVIRRELAYRQ